jgi:diguanylate cyclase (GGDEF)-like protein/PAS domain S-box-containing protein
VTEVSDNEVTSHPDVERWRKRLEREKAARLETEAIAETTTRELYEKQQELLLLQEIAAAANEASTVEDALQAAVDGVCSFTGWPVGNAYLAADDGSGELVPSGVWHLSEPTKFAAFKTITDATRFQAGIGLPGRVLASGIPAWIMDVNRDDNFPRAKQAIDIGVKAGFGFPVRAGKEIVAVLEFFSAEPAEPNDRLLVTMDHIGTQLGRVIERTRAEHALQASEAQYRLLFERNLAGVYRTTIAGKVLSCNPALARILGYDSAEELLSTPVLQRYPDPVERERLLAQLHESGSVAGYEVRLRRKDDKEIWVLENATLTRAKEGSDSVIEGTVIEITERKQAEDMIRYMAYHDYLTRLPNRALFQDRLTVALAQARRHREGMALMSLDLDRFKLVNDTLGHAAGDALLKAVGDRLLRTVREGDTVARVGGDEFLILLTGVDHPEYGAKVARKILAAFGRPFRIEGRQLHATASVGISLYPHDGDEADVLARNADAAMYRAKETGRNNYQLYAPAMNVRAAERLALENDLWLALKRGEFEVYYQPQVKIDTGQIVGAEALLRWNHPIRGVVSPDEFIPAAEETGMIVRIGEWVLRNACREVNEWIVKGLQPIRLAVNISMRQFQSRDFVETVERALKDTGFDPRLLELEITESIAMQDEEQTIRILQSLREMGLRISIDDFGTGYSSLKYLKDLPIHALKIDQSFIRELTTNVNDAMIASNIIAIAHSLNLSVIAEGVETGDQLDFLKDKRCDEFQGYLCKRPMAAESFVRLLAQRELTQTPR